MGDDMEQARRFLDTLYGDGLVQRADANLLIVSHTPAAQGIRRTTAGAFRDLSDAAAFAIAQSDAGRDVFTDGALYDGESPNPIGFVAAWLDIDVAPSSYANAAQFMAEFELEPTIVLSSGYCLEVVWSFEEPRWVATEDECARAAAFIINWQAFLIQRVLPPTGIAFSIRRDASIRVPGTISHSQAGQLVSIRSTSSARWHLPPAVYGATLH